MKLDVTLKFADGTRAWFEAPGVTFVIPRLLWEARGKPENLELSLRVKP